jgi:hypothetical protein
MLLEKSIRTLTEFLAYRGARPPRQPRIFMAPFRASKTLLEEARTAFYSSVMFEFSAVWDFAAFVKRIGSGNRMQLRNVRVIGITLSAAIELAVMPVDKVVHDSIRGTRLRRFEIWLQPKSGRRGAASPRYIDEACLRLMMFYSDVLGINESILVLKDLYGHVLSRTKPCR